MWQHAQSFDSLAVDAARSTRSRLALLDVLCLGYHSYMLLRVALSPRGESWPLAMAWTTSLLAVAATAIFVARGGAVTSARQRSQSHAP